MASRTIRWTRRALRRLDQIAAHIAHDNPDAAARTVARIALAVSLLSDHPAMGRPGRVKGTRELVLADIPYIVAYRVSETHLDVLAVMHTSQKWPQAFG